MTSDTDRGRVGLERRGAVATITIDRPEKLNTFTVTMSEQLVRIVDELNRDDGVRAAVVRAVGERAFSAGSDVALLDDLGTPWEGRNRAELGRDYPGALYRLRVPLVAAIRGYCLGGGLEVALVADIRIASPSATFGAPEIRLGWHAGSGNTTILPRIIGYGNAARWILTGDRFNAQEAFRVGLVQEVVPDDRLEERAAEIAERIARNAPVAVQAAKHLIRATQGTPIATGLAYENDLYTLCMTTQDSREGIAAFLAKRDPLFRGE